jgi:hypothetical protein
MASAARGGVPVHSHSSLPVFLVAGCPTAFAGQPELFYTTDPGKALLSAKCSDLNHIKGPVLRGLGGRAPYFHNGAAATLGGIVNFYDQRFQMGLTALEQRQPVAFLQSVRRWAGRACRRAGALCRGNAVSK